MPYSHQPLQESASIGATADKRRAPGCPTKVYFDSPSAA